MNKKVVLGFAFFIAVLILIPLLQMVMFSNSTSGKIMVNQPIEALYLKNSDHSVQLLFFGYVGCTKVCTPVLQHLSELYDSQEFAPYRSKTEVVFVNLMPDISSDQVQYFAKSFHKDFKGVYLNSKEIMTIDRKMGVFFADSLSQNGEIDHSDHLYLITTDEKGEKILKNIYTTHPINKALITQDIQKLVSSK
jgi:protein SCO1/2